MKTIFYKIFLVFTLSLFSIVVWSKDKDKVAMISGKIISSENKIVDYATVHLKGTSYGGTTNEDGIYHLKAPAGTYTLVVSAVGYEVVEKEVKLIEDERIKLNITVTPKVEELEEVAVVANGISRLKRSAYNAVAVDTKALQNSTQSLSDALARAPGMKVRESGGVGSDMKLMLDGFTGEHVKVFIDGVPQEGVGSSFGLNNIPVNYAERIEVYRGVVPVGFGTDAIGGVINVVTKKNTTRWFADASYSYGSFNTHKSYVNFGQTMKNGFTYEVNAFQNYSDNNYYIYTPVEIFDGKGGSSTSKELKRVKRFHDTYHNEAIVGKVGLTGKRWADRLMIGLAYSRMYNDIQNGVRQEIVFGERHSKGHSLMPSFEYSKRDILTPGLDVILTANYNKNIRYVVDTSSYRYNWYGDKNKLKLPGEQSYQNTRSDNKNWNGTFSANYRIGNAHTFTFNQVFNSFTRSSESLLAGGGGKNPIDDQIRKNISGLSYRLMPMDQWNISVFGKYYHQFVAGPVAASSSQSTYERSTKTVSQMGYGAAGTYFILRSLQAKLSYEQTYRLPTITEIFGDEDQEKGEMGLKPEKSDNVNFSLSYNESFDKHSLYVEGGLIYRNTKDFIQRNINSGSGGKSYGGYQNHARVLAKGYSISLRYGFSDWVSVGGNFTQIDARDNVKTISNQSSQESSHYKARMKNVPYQFANSDITFFWRKLWKQSNVLSVTYDNFYMHSFPLRWENLGSSGKEEVPSQFSHNVTVSYAMQNGRYNLTFECQNLTDEKIYDNFSLQKAGRAFYGKVRVYFGN